MSIRIRVYPQQYSVGAIRTRAIRRQRQLYRQQLSFQRQLQRQQLRTAGFGTVATPPAPGWLGGTFGAALGSWGSPYATGSTWQVPSASSWGFSRSPYAPAYASTSAAWTGGWHSQPYLPYGAGYGSPASLAFQAGTGVGWLAAAC